MVKFSNITYKYDKKSKVKALTDVSFETPKNGLVVIVGENGSGKSTLINQLGHKSKFDGNIEINGKDIKNYKANELSKLIAFLPQKLEFPENIPVLDVIAIGRNPYTNVWGKLSKHDKAIINKYSRVMQVEKLYDKMFSSLSGGQQQRVFIAMILCQEAPIVIFDEPTNHLDVRYQIEIFNLINEIKKDKLVIMTTHNLNMASKYGDQFVFLKKGKLVDEGTNKIVNKTNIKKLFKVKAEITKHNGKPFILDMELDHDEAKR